MKLSRMGSAVAIKKEGVACACACELLKMLDLASLGGKSRAKRSATLGVDVDRRTDS